MKEYEELITVRDTFVDGIKPWYWLKSDHGAWDGPKEDWEKEHKLKWLSHVKTWDACFQAGGALGMYPRLLSEHFLDVYTFEPDPLSFYVLNLNCQKDNIHKFNAACGPRPGMTGIVRGGMENVGTHRTEGEGTTTVLMIDSLNLPSCGLIALDIEGNEISALKGAVQTIRRCSPVITCENAGVEIRDFMTDMGYHDVDKSVSDTVFVKL